MKRAKSRFTFKPKTEKFQNKIIQDCNGDELEFPDVDANDTPTVGDRIVIDNKSNETGERLMPNGETIVFENGIVTEILEPEEPKNLIRTRRDSLNRKIQILGPDKKKPYLKGNRILIDGREPILAKVQLNGIKITAFRGQISSVKRVN